VNTHKLVGVGKHPTAAKGTPNRYVGGAHIEGVCAQETRGRPPTCKNEGQADSMDGDPAGKGEHADGDPAGTDGGTSKGPAGKGGGTGEGPAGKDL
jgi:hypothetical protein